MIKIVTLSLICFILLSSLTVKVMGQTNDFDYYDKKLEEINELVASIEAQRANLTVESNSLVEEINGLRADYELDKTVVTKMRLRDALQRSNRLSKKMELLRDELSDLNKQVKEHNLEFDSFLDIEIDRLIVEFENTEDESEKKEKLEKIFQFRKKKDSLVKQVQETVGQAADYTVGDEIQILPSDDAQVITEKADLLKDLSEKADRRIVKISNMIKELVKEEKTRDKLAAFVYNIDLFEDNGLVGSIEGGNETFRDETTAGTDRGQSSLTSDGSQDIARDLSLVKEGDNLATASIESELKRLQRERKLLTIRKNLLEEKAEEFYSKARTFNFQ